MTLVSEIIKSAYRESNLIPLTATPNSTQETEGLNRLNSLILSTLGNEAGGEVMDLMIGGDYDQSDICSDHVPDDVRLVLNLSATDTLELDPTPYEGQRLSLIDSASNLATYNLTLDGNGRNIEGAATLTLSTNGENRQWLYRADTANWVRIESLETTDQMPFPEEFDDYFITMLAVRINPRYGQAMAEETVKMLTRAKSQIRARYRKKPAQFNFFALGLIRPRDHTWIESDFDNGEPTPWL